MGRDCAFCQIVRGEKPVEFVHKGDSLVVFKDTHPHAPVHWLVVPRRHIRSVDDLREEDRELVSDMILTARSVAKDHGLAQSGYKLLFNVERGGGQMIFHLHLHVMGGWP